MTTQSLKILQYLCFPCIWMAVGISRCLYRIFHYPSASILLTNSPDATSLIFSTCSICFRLIISCIWNFICVYFSKYPMTIQKNSGRCTKQDKKTYGIGIYYIKHLTQLIWFLYLFRYSSPCSYWSSLTKFFPAQNKDMEILQHDMALLHRSMLHTFL